MLTINQKFGFQKEKDVEDWLWWLFQTSPDMICECPSGKKFPFFHFYDEDGTDHGRIWIEDMIENVSWHARKFFACGAMLPADEQMPSWGILCKLVADKEEEESIKMLRDLNVACGLFYSSIGNRFSNL